MAIIDLTALKTILGIDGTGPGAPDYGHVQTLAEGEWSFGSPVLLTGKNYDGSQPEINSVTGSVDGAGGSDDYEVKKLGNSWYIIPKDGTEFATEAQDIVINSNVVPSDDSLLSSLITTVEADFLRIRGIAFDVDDSEATVYPDTAGVVAAEMIRWRLANEYGMKSESMGDRRYDRETMVMGYPLSIVSLIDVYGVTL